MNTFIQFRTTVREKKIFEACAGERKLTVADWLRGLGEEDCRKVLGKAALFDARKPRVVERSYVPGVEVTVEPVKAFKVYTPNGAEVVSIPVGEVPPEPCNDTEGIESANGLDKVGEIEL